MESDLDKAELLRQRTGELTGDRLLNTDYITTTSPASRKKRVRSGRGGGHRSVTISVFTAVC